MANITRPPQDPLGFTTAVEHESGEVWLDVVHRWHDPWHTTVTTAFRGWKAPKQNLSYERRFLMRSHDQHPNRPLSEVTCIARHAGTNDPSTAAIHLDTMLNAMQVQAQKEGIMLYELDDPALKPYWNTEFDRDTLNNSSQRYTAGKPAYRPGESLPEPIALAIQHELLNGDYGFQLTTDQNAPTIEMLTITKDKNFCWNYVQQAIDHVKQDPAPAKHLEIQVTTNYGKDMHRLFPKCIPLDDEWTALTTNRCPPSHVQRMLAKANTTRAGFEEYDPDTPHNEYVEDMLSEAVSRAYSTIYPKNGPLASFLSKTIRDASQQKLDAPTRPISIMLPESEMALIAHTTEQPHTAVPTELLTELEETLSKGIPQPDDEQHFQQVEDVARRLIDLKPKWHQLPASE